MRFAPPSFLYIVIGLESLDVQSSNPQKSYYDLGPSLAYDVRRNRVRLPEINQND